MNTIVYHFKYNKFNRKWLHKSNQSKFQKNWTNLQIKLYTLKKT